MALVPAPRRSRRLVLARRIGFTLLFALVFLDFVLISINPHQGRGRPILLIDATGLAALLWPAQRRPRWLPPAVRTGVPAALSLALTLPLLLRAPLPYLPFGETVLLLCLLLLAVRDCAPAPAAVVAVLNAVALIAMPLRIGSGDPGPRIAWASVVALLAACAAGLGGYLRSLDHQRTTAVAGVRRDERMAIAADLHDFVAHHVTGILVQTQVARMLAASEPDQLDPVLAGIEQAATESLASMRSLVGVLRTHAEDAAATRPGGDLAALADLVARFSRVGPPAVLVREPSVPDGLPYEVQAAAHRIAQEALTNVRRHALDATEVTVRLRFDGRELIVTVTDDGRGAARLPEAARGGGFGLIGLTERVTALGGRLDAGPRDGVGWEVQALLPAGGRGAADASGAATDGEGMGR